MVQRLRTGVEVLDRKLGGGIPTGSLVALCAQPASQAELFLHELTAMRGTLYVTLGRTEAAVADSIQNSPTRTGTPTIRHVTGDAPIDNAAKFVSALPEASNLIVDPADVLERHDADRYRNFLNEVQNHLQNTGSMAVFYCLDGIAVPPGRDTTRHMADVVFDLETHVGSDEIENRLTVPKFRGGRALTDVVKLGLAEEVTIDTSRDIA
ncbi:RAD55 family ATPase [Halomarina halobia]|uniref:RAD55 family ATPase n=1 Tax=Halomarina halobia TaxID=3033386 RepID=A0ABD6A5Y3_9EURY|nr:transcriptional regulator [Halomarina sp. PSR21]